MPQPSVGRIVHYTLSEQDAVEINRRREHFRASGNAYANSGFAGHVGNEVRQGDVYPAMIVRTWGPDATSAVNLQVWLDGNDTFWATSRTLGEGPFHWAWPERV